MLKIKTKISRENEFTCKNKLIIFDKLKVNRLTYGFNNINS